MSRVHVSRHMSPRRADSTTLYSDGRALKLNSAAIKGAREICCKDNARVYEELLSELVNLLKNSGERLRYILLIYTFAYRTFKITSVFDILSNDKKRQYRRSKNCTAETVVPDLVCGCDARAGCGGFFFCSLELAPPYGNWQGKNFKPIRQKKNCGTALICYAAMERERDGLREKEVEKKKETD
ncbi:hypothetical protein EVAR_46727_1 [Eumeta japonica]|uniref:Uncharacterized protein n=1 Tax=Eumeta variegata TaxID=151549 RepID=A0A4C1XDW4_EUMVA|nr:hypothetical protein EVAR_46727_1 [Eumeta japonica]